MVIFVRRFRIRWQNPALFTVMEKPRFLPSYSSGTIPLPVIIGTGEMLLIIGIVVIAVRKK